MANGVWRQGTAPPAPPAAVCNDCLSSSGRGLGRSGCGNAAVFEKDRLSASQDRSDSFNQGIGATATRPLTRNRPHARMESPNAPGDRGRPGICLERHHLRQPIQGRPGDYRHQVERSAIFWLARQQLGRGGAMTGSAKAIRSAIYTRVSTDLGLDQEFYSLDAQYDAASAYIRIQAHARWTLVRTRYDDGGFSGGSTDRPALQRLLADVKAR